MKKTITVLTIILFAACSKKSGTVYTPDTALELSIVNKSTNQLAAGASVSLFTSALDCLNNTNAISVRTTNSSGVVKFSSLTPAMYYWRATDGCADNTFDINTTNAPLSKGNVTTFTASIRSTGNMKFVNNSSNPYRVFVNDVLMISSQSGNTTAMLKMPAGAKTVRVLQLSGYVFTPTEKTYVGALTCGGTLQTVYP